jgi:hypothetical protein
MKYLIEHAIKTLERYTQESAAFYENTELKKFSQEIATEIKGILSEFLKKNEQLPEVIKALEEKLTIIQRKRDDINSTKSAFWSKAGEGTLEPFIKKLVKEIRVDAEIQAERGERFSEVKEKFTKRLSDAAEKFKGDSREQAFRDVQAVVNGNKENNFDSDELDAKIRDIMHQDAMYFAYGETIYPFMCYIFEGEEEPLNEMAKIQLPEEIEMHQPAAWRQH